MSAQSDVPQRFGGLAIAKKKPPPVCPRCDKKIVSGTKWHSYLGHLGLHGLADRHFAGDVVVAQKRLRDNGLARQDPAPWNGAWPVYIPMEDLCSKE